MARTRDQGVLQPMGATPSHRRVRQFAAYMASTFCLGRHLRGLRDRRRRVEVPGFVIGCVLLVGLALRARSMMELERWVRAGAFRKLVGRHRLPLRDCLRDWAMAADVASAWAINDAILATARKNETFRGGSVHGWHVVALDGTEVLRTQARCCAACQVYRHRDGRVEYAHRVVAAQTVRWRHGDEGTIRVGARVGTCRRWCGHGAPAAEGRGGRRCLRLLRRLQGTHGHFCDVVTVDALYAQAPFLEAVRALGLHVVVRLKDERYAVVQDAAGLRRGRRYGEAFVTRIGSFQVEVRVWDSPELTSWEGLKHPIRVVYAEEELSWTEHQGTAVWHCKALRILEVATTLSPAEASGRVVWEIARSRWGVENEGFRQLKQEWHLDHGFLHHPTGMQVLWALLAAGYNLFQLFLARRIRRRGPWEQTERGVAERLRAELLIGEGPLGLYLVPDTS
ncbi:transposase [Geochorda subterranea]|uniref:Transposase n=1 Tax=Geochorda subterranea TaxID=3109564 RepID=A0ABZ1BMP4_9FIRM|nr:transposase [Limnochorda sp. LNt]WRP13969.1 transposase [Limnochorda sp. LNt]